jgi:hypothetical protein
MISTEDLLFVEPAESASATPIIDQITRKMCGAFRKATECRWYNGWHECFCGALSTPCDYSLPNGEVTNALCVHYVAHHRSEVPPPQLAKVGALSFGEADPSGDELQSPETVLTRVRSSVEGSLGRRGLSTWITWGLDLEALCRGLRGGKLPSTVFRQPRQAFTHARKEAEDLFHLLVNTKPGSLPSVKDAVEKEFGDVRRWAEKALCTPGWDRVAWASALVTLYQHSNGKESGLAGLHLESLGAAAVPTLMESAKKAAGNNDFLHAVNRALAAIGKQAGVSFLSQLPRSLIRIPICERCKGEGICTCRL